MAEATDAAVPVKPPKSERWSAMMVRRLSPLAWKKFIPGESEPVNPELPKSEIQRKCFAVLGYLEQYYRTPSLNPTEIKIDTPHKKDGLEELEKQLDTVLEPFSPINRQHPDVGQHQKMIQQKLSHLLASPEVRKRFEEEFKEELPKYQAAREPMRQVRNIDRVVGKLRRAIYKRYLGDKQQYGKLTQSSVDQIYFFQGKLDTLEDDKQGIESVASKETRGYLETQKLLDYKKQLREKGFVITPSREQLIDRITREALAGKKIFLVGSTGTGKTQLAFYALNNLTGGYELINWHEGTTPRDLFGYRELWTDELGGVQSGMKPGPVPKGLERGVGVVHEEYTGGSTRTQLAAKFMMGARPGDKIQIPGFNGQIFDVTNNFVEIFTGNPRDERTKQREDMDPAILRELTGVEVSYMSAPEMYDIIRSMLIEESGVLKLSQAEAIYIKKLAGAAEVMQKIHNRDFEGFSPQLRTLLGIDTQGNTDTTLNKNFLDPGTLFKLFDSLDLHSARATKGQTFADYTGNRLTEFITDPKSLSTPEERKTLQKILHTYGLITDASGSVQVSIPHQNQDKGYILPSKMAEEVLSSINPMGTSPDTDRSRPETRAAEQMFGEDFLGEEAIHKFEEKCRAKGINVEFEISQVVFPYTDQDLQAAKHEEPQGKARMVVLRPQYMTVDGTRQEVNILNLRNLFREEVIQQDGTKKTVFTNNPFGDGPVFYPYEWYDTGENFAKEALKPGYALPTKDVLPNSWNEKWADQNALFGPGERRREAEEAVWDTLLYYAKTGNKLLTTKWDWTNSQASVGSRVIVAFGSGGLRVDGWPPDDPYDDLGAASSR